MKAEEGVAHTADILRLLGNRVNVQIMIMLRRNAMSPRDLSQRLGKDEADIVRRLRIMQKSGLVKSAWGSRLGKNVKLYSLTTSTIGISIQHNGMQIEYKSNANINFFFISGVAGMGKK